MVPDSDSHILSSVKPGLVATVSSQDIVLFQHIEHHLVGCLWWQNLAEEVVCLRWHDPQKADLSKFLLKIVSLSKELPASSLIVFLVFVVYLHKELCERVEVPY